MPDLKRTEKSYPFTPISNDPKQGFRHAKMINKPFGEVEHVLDWCKSELTDEWRWQLIEVSTDRKPGEYIFYFDNERDYLAFILKWG